MKKRKCDNGRSELFLSGMFILLFAVWTIMLQTVDVQSIGPNDSSVGLAAFNQWFHNLTGVNLTIYILTDWLGLVPIFICLIFASLGLGQLLKRRSLGKVDYDIILLGIYYSIVILSFLIFETIPLNYRPVLIEGVLEVSYPSSTTLLVLTVMPALVEQSRRRIKNKKVKNCLIFVTSCFSSLMVFGRLISGVHWFTDIAGGCLLSAGLFWGYKGAVRWWNFTKNCRN